MSISDERIEYAVRNTEILRLPRQSLATFGSTSIYYYLLTEPVYSELMPGTSETVIREGRVIAEKPKIVTPYYLTHVEGFSPDARRYFERLLEMHGPNAPGLFYTYKNEPKELNIVSDSLPAVVAKLNTEIDRRGDTLASIIKGEDALWDVSLIRFIYELTRSSLQDNLTQLGTRGLLDIDDAGIPADARARIDDLFRGVARGEVKADRLKAELNRWGLFAEYEDRFLNLFKKG
ncbi:hypothetical protein ACFLUE_03025 [Chloroflexota bacterium]